MAADAGRRLDVANLLSFGDDVVGVLLDSKDGESLAQAYDGARMLRSACHSESGDLKLQVKEHQDKINSCKEKLDKAKSGTVTDEELSALRNEMKGKLQSEQQLRQDLREVSDELDNLDLQRASIEERKNDVKKMEKDMLKAQSMLSMCVSVTTIMPNFEDQDKISGYTVDKNMKKLEKFEFEKTMSPVEICDKFWKMI
ncbi:kinetochore protein SPC24 homolog isoform X1 [Lolium rigidum]|uniref:kinetochore protein SPC24 homolog isoform X1 n=1 Tax=Lolium rigidum TaxID=89674 RepID=UPI001F5C6A8B|nr:kinetochore protein SPC24 homolog isoform X1 [Lolium rigidum]